MVPPAADEIVSERTEYARTYRLGSGARRTVISPVPVHYRDKDGDWQPIDTDLVADGADGVQTADSPVAVSAPRQLGDGPVKVTDEERWVSFALDGADAPAQVTGSTATYPDAVSSTDAEMTATPSGVKETLTIQDGGAPAAYHYTLDASSGLSPVKQDDGSVAILDEQGAARFVLPAPTVQEAGGPLRTDLVSYQLSQDGARLTVAVDPQWLAQAQFPVEVDPSVSKLVTSCALTSGSLASTSSCNGSTLQLGRSTSTGPVSRIAMRLPSLGGIPQTATIVDGALGMRLLSQTAVGATPEVDVRRLARTITTAATWNSYQSGSEWTTPGGDTTGAYDRSQIRTSWVGSISDFAYFDISPIVEQWVRGDANRGLLMQLRSESTTDLLTFAGSGATSGNLPFVTIDWVRQPGRERDKTYESQSIDDHSDLADEVSSGNASASSTDLVVPGTGGYDLTFGRTYNATDDVSQRRVLADHWTFIINGAALSLARNYPNDGRVLRLGNGAVYRFDRDPDNDTSGHLAYRTPAGIDASMDTTTADGKTTVTFTSGAVWTYSDSFPGDLISVSDGQGHLFSTFQALVGPDGVEPTEIRNSSDTTVATLSYDTTGALTAISDTTGHTWHYGQTSGTGAWTLDSVTDPSSNVTHYDYNTSGQLTSILDAAGHSTTLAYGNGSNGDSSQLTSVTSAGSPAVVTSFNYLPAATDGHACDDAVSGVALPENHVVGRTVVTRSPGGSTTYCYNADGQVLETWAPADGPTLAVTGDLFATGLDDSGRESFDVSYSAADPGSDLTGVEILVDGLSRERDDGACAPSCATITNETYVDLGTLTEGRHRIQVLATDAAGNRAWRTWTVDAPGEQHYAAALAAWRSTVQVQVDAASSAALTGSMPTPPDSWRHAADCEATTDALRACYDAIMDWGDAVQDWMADNLPDNTAAATLPDPPTFEYSRAGGVQLDLTHRIRDAMTVARHYVADPTGTLDVAIGFHRPLTPAEVRAAIPEHATLQSTSALSGSYEPIDASWGGTVQVSTPSSVDTSIEDFYVKQSQLISSTIASLQQETPEDADDQADIARSLSQAQAFKAALDARGAYITGVTVRLNPTTAARVMSTAVAGETATNVKAIAPVTAAGGGTIDAGDQANALASMTVDAVTVDQGASAAGTAAEPAEPTCDDRGEAGLFRGSTLDPNPRYWAPSRHWADTELGDADGGHHMKVHHLRFRWLAQHSLAWMCAAESGKRNVELEAMVDPENGRWSTNWEAQSARKYTQTNMPGTIHQDDLADGQFPGPLNTAKYPDFAIVAQGSRSFRYRKRYFVDFTTNEGETDQGRVIYSAQPTARNFAGWQSEYCAEHFQDYKSCMFAKVDVCYNQAFISEGPMYRVIDWSTRLGVWQSMREVAKYHPDEVSNGTREVSSFCDPRPPHSGDQG